ncbi:hypothetical protein [Staphylococcus cohnii]|uniref:hypothetical protein n=1 Tax=Staphylococcus cohnii TaxID=29382 RepID=UPI0018695027|nr:hypothetical protein [Staphylococcus cohnii]
MDYAQQLERIEAKKAKERMATNKKGTVPGPYAKKGETREIVGKTVGFGSGRTYGRAKYIYENAVETTNQRLNVMLNAKDLIDDLQERAKANQGKRNDLTFNSAEPKVNKAPVHENKEIAI